MNNLANIQGRRTVTHPGGPRTTNYKDEFRNLYQILSLHIHNSTGFCDWLSFGVSYSDAPDNSIKEPLTYVDTQKQVKVRQFQSEFMKSSFLPKYEQKIVRISALCSEGRNLDNSLFVFWEKRWLHKFILKLTDL